MVNAMLNLASLCVVFKSVMLMRFGWFAGC